MRTKTDGDLIHWTTRITLRRQIQEDVRTLARDDLRSIASMIGILLSEALTARST